MNTLLARDKELDFIFERIYEKNVFGKITDERFSKMSRKYEDEQGELAARVKVLETDLSPTKRRIGLLTVYIFNYLCYIGRLCSYRVCGQKSSIKFP